MSPYTSRLLRKDDGQAGQAAVFEHIVGHGDVFHGPVRVAHKLVHFGVGGQVHHHVHLRVFDAADALLVRRVGAGEVLQEVAEAVGPGVDALVHAEHLVPVVHEPQRQVGADLPG